MKTAKIRYLGNLRTEATHLRSGKSLFTDAPVDNKGKGEAFSPTDLLATSLGNCMMTIMGIVAREQGIDLQGMEVEITKIMAENPRRVSEIIVEFQMPERDYSAEEKELLKDAAIHCPVANSLSGDLKQTVIFHQNGEDFFKNAREE